MAKRKYKYRTRLFALTALLFEVIFWFVAWQLLEVLGVFNHNVTGERLSFLYPNFVWLNFLIIPIIFTVFIFQMYQRNWLINQFENPKTLKTFLQPVQTIRLFIRYFLIRNALVFVIFALMQPALGSKTVQGTTDGIDLIFAVDISNSMNTRDIVNGNSRLEVSKRAMYEIINQSSVARVGVLIFAGSSYPQLPLTTDIDAAKMYIDELNTDLISNQGTNLSAALNDVGELFTTSETKKVMVLITDGEDHEGGMESIYKSFQKDNIESYILGVGTEKGGIVPQSFHKNARPMKDEFGRVVVSKVNRQILIDLAKNLDGSYMLTNEAFPNVSQLLTEINSKSGTNTVDLEFKVKENRYQWPLGISLMFIFILFVWESVPHRKNKS
ncbi:MAG: VWA domain-containing protein [Brumimicrobium sp.]